MNQGVQKIPRHLPAGPGIVYTAKTPGMKGLGSYTLSWAWNTQDHM